MAEKGNLKLKTIDNALMATYPKMFSAEIDHLSTATRNLFKALDVQSVNPLRKFHAQTAEITRAINSFNTLRLRSVDPLKEFRTQTAQIARAINSACLLDEVAKSIATLISTRAVGVNVFIEPDPSKIIEQPDRIHYPDDPGHSTRKKVFIVCGKDAAAKQTVARYIQKLGLEEIIIDEQPSGALTRIEKLEKYTDDVSFTVALLTPDDVGKPKDEFGEPNFRPSQDVIWELVTLICKYGRNRICLLYKGKLELPSYMNGINLVPMDTNGGWILNLIREMEDAGLSIDIHKVI